MLRELESHAVWWGGWEPPCQESWKDPGWVEKAPGHVARPRGEKYSTGGSCVGEMESSSNWSDFPEKE